jgi:hypothetical protein
MLEVIDEMADAAIWLIELTAIPADVMADIDATSSDESRVKEDAVVDWAIDMVADMAVSSPRISRLPAATRGVGLVTREESSVTCEVFSDLHGWEREGCHLGNTVS